MAGRRAINLKVLASIKSLGKTKAVIMKCEKKVTLKVPVSVSTFWCVKHFDKKCLMQITNEALRDSGSSGHTRAWCLIKPVPHKGS